MLDIKEFLLEFDENLLIMDGFDDCIEGVSIQFGQDYKVCYDISKIVDKLKSQGMNDEEALEYFEFNQLGAYVGDKSPCFITKYKHGDSFS
jgi:hypothetical protein